ncbi:hypothetical protein M422DRAFT_175303, partial [Sphaerobolus stellatus SS14]
MDESSSPEHIANVVLAKQLEPLHEAWESYGTTKETIFETALLLSDPDPSMRSLAAKEQDELLSSLSSQILDTFPSLLLPPSETSRHFALMEMKAGVGGDEATLFAADLLRMYGRLCEVNGWPMEVISRDMLDGGKGMKNAVIEIKGEGAYDALRWESGVHRVQRVPETEKSARLHTSTVAVVVLPLAQDNGSQKEE